MNGSVHYDRMKLDILKGRGCHFFVPVSLRSSTVDVNKNQEVKYHQNSKLQDHPECKI